MLIHFFTDLKDVDTDLKEARKSQRKLELDLDEIKWGWHKSEEQKSIISLWFTTKNIKFYNDYFLLLSQAIKK